jgi:hypothetical protein
MAKRKRADPKTKPADIVTSALTRDEYLATFVEPMRRLEADETYKPVQIGKYVAVCIQQFEPPVRREQLEIQHVYLNAKQSFYHVLIHYGQRNKLFVIVVDCDRKAIHGHYLLDLNEEYGLNEKGSPNNESVA